jgi:hypothetical protein
MPQPDNATLYDMLVRLVEKQDTSVEKQGSQHTEVMEAVAVLQTQMKSLLGNGQPGRITVIEAGLAKLKRSRYIEFGYASALGTMLYGVMAVLGYIFQHWKKG